MGEFLGLAARNHLLQGVSWMNPKPPKSFWEESPPTLPSKIVDYCKQTMPPHGSVGKESQAMQETQETQVQSLGRGDPLENVMATHSSFLAWRIPWTEESGGLQSTRLQRVRHNWATNNFLILSYFPFGFYLFKNSFYYEWSEVLERGTSGCMCLIFHCYPLVFVFIIEENCL